MTNELYVISVRLESAWSGLSVRFNRRNRGSKTYYPGYSSYNRLCRIVENRHNAAGGKIELDRWGWSFTPA